MTAAEPTDLLSWAEWFLDQITYQSGPLGNQVGIVSTNAVADFEKVIEAERVRESQDAFEAAG